MGGAVCKVMTAMGNDPMPWQRDALAVTCEIDPATGSFYYDTVIIVVLRRAGKTTMSRGKVLHRALTTQDALMVYTAQNRIKALARLRKDFHKPIERSPFKSYMAKPRWRGGEEALLWKNGAELAIDAVGRKSGHGDTLHEGHIDEAYAHTDSTLEDGVQPATATVVGSQLWILSAAGDLGSHYLNEKMDLGRALVESELPSRTCYIEYSAELDWDPNDPETLLNTHPAVGYTIEVDRVMSQRVAKSEESLRGWERAWLGWRPKPKAPPRVIPAAGWEKNYILDEDQETWSGTPFWAIDTDPDRETTSIALAARSMDPEAACYVELYENQPGTSGVVATMVKLRAEFGGNIIAIDGNGAAKSLRKDLEAEGFEVILVPGPSRVDACSGFYDDALVGKLRFINDPDLNTSMGNAVKQSVGGRAWIFARNKSLASISGLYAVTFARWLFKEKAGEEYDVGDSLG